MAKTEEVAARAHLDWRVDIKNGSPAHKGSFNPKASSLQKMRSQNTPAPDTARTCKESPSRQKSTANIRDDRSREVTRLSRAREAKGNWRTVFLASLRANFMVSIACRDAGISRKTVYRHRSLDPEFAQQWAEAKEYAIELMELRARELALHGWLEPVYQKGTLVGHRRVYSERLLLLLLNADNPRFAEAQRAERRCRNARLTDRIRRSRERLRGSGQ